MLEIGNKIVYGKTGVCTVVGQCEKELSRNVKKQYFVLKPFGSDTNTIFVPVENNKVFMRPLISKEEAKDLINRIPEIIGSTADIELSKEQYELMVSTHNPEDLMGLTVRLHAKRKDALANRKKPGFIDEKYMALADKLLFGELAEVLETPYDEIKKEILKKFKV